MTRTSHLGELN